MVMLPRSRSRSGIRSDPVVSGREFIEFAAEFGVEIPFVEVTNVTSLWEFWRRINGGAVA